MSDRMTDLERAQAVLHEVSLARSPVKAMVAILAAARREGAELAEWQCKLEREAGAEEMRERAKAACHERSQWAASKIANENADAMWATYSNACDDCLYFIAALPLTPEEP